MINEVSMAATRRLRDFFAAQIERRNFDSHVSFGHGGLVLRYPGGGVRGP